MKLSSLLLAGTALPFLAFSSAASPLPQPSTAPLVVAQGAPGELPPRARPGQDQPDAEEGAPQRRGPPGRERAPGAQREERQRTPQAGEAPRAPRASSQGEAPEAPRPHREPGPPSERPEPPAGRVPPQQGRPTQAQERPQGGPEERPAPERAAPPQRAQEPERAAPQRPQERAQEKPAEKPQERTQERPQERPPSQQPSRPDRAAPEVPPSAEPRRQPAERTPPAPRAPQSPDQQPAARSAPPAPSAPAAETAPPAPAPKVAPTPAPSATAPQAPRPGGAAPAAPAGQLPAQQGARPQPPAPAQQPAQQLQRPEQAPAAGAPTEARRPGDRDVQSFESFEQGRIDDLRRQRRERTEEGGRRVIIEEPGDRTIVREGDRVIIRHDETDRLRRTYGDADVRQERRGSEDVTIVRRPDGTEIVSVRDPDGHLVRRVRRDRSGQEVVLIDNGRENRRDRYFVEDVVRLPPPVVRIPREEYIVDVEDASQDDLVQAFTAPPVERIDRAYTLDEIRQSETLRERMRRVDLDTVTFDTGSWELPEYQIGAMTGIAQAIQRALAKNPNEIFLVEGHTDAVGSDEDNLTLSDRRAETVATILARRFGVPAENLTTQGYGEQYLKVNTQGPERQNRRVTIRRITPLLQGQNAQR